MSWVDIPENHTVTKTKKEIISNEWMNTRKLKNEKMSQLIPIGCEKLVTIIDQHLHLYFRRKNFNYREGAN